MSNPKPAVAEPWGSRSTSNTPSPVCASPAARLIAVVVFPVPPFWFEIAIVGITPSFQVYLLTNKQIALCIYYFNHFLLPLQALLGLFAATPLGHVGPR